MLRPRIHPSQQRPFQQIPVPLQTPNPLDPPARTPDLPFTAARPAHRPARPGLAAPEVVPARQEVLPSPPLATARGAALLRAACGAVASGRALPPGSSRNAPEAARLHAAAGPAPAVSAGGCPPRGGCLRPGPVGPSASEAPRAFTPQR